MSEPISRRKLFAYSILGIPIGFIGLPLYVHLPKYYADFLPISLAAIGGVMFIARLADCFADPWIGYCSDRFASKRKQWMIVASVLMAAGVIGLFALPQFASETNAVWLLGILLVITYLSYSVLSIYFYTAGLALSTDYEGTTRVSAWRESAIILGVLLASALPQILAVHVGEKSAYHLFSYCFVAILVLCVWSWLSRNPFNKKSNSEQLSPWQELKENPSLRWIFILFFVNAIPPSITATLFLFFVTDILHASEQGGAFLGVYFLCAVLSMPCWSWLSTRIGKRRALVAAMFLAVASFVWAYALSEGQVGAFYVICFLSGAALGGDLTILPSLLADALSHKPHRGGLEFGIWNFISKFTLALAAGIALPVLSYMGYVPNQPLSSVYALSFSYALLPSIFKLLALSILLISPIDTQRRSK
jgi:GPH family glycoside/pentoside/hexuronide:cation symporter